VGTAEIPEKTACALTWASGAQLPDVASMTNMTTPKLGTIDFILESSTVHLQPGPESITAAAYASSPLGVGFLGAGDLASVGYVKHFFLFLSNPISGAATTVSLTFATSVGMAPKDKITLSLKAKWTLAAAGTAPTASAGCGASPIFSTGYAGSGSYNAAITWTVETGTVAAYAKCTITSTTAAETKVHEDTTVVISNSVRTGPTEPQILVAYHADSGPIGGSGTNTPNVTSGACPASNGIACVANQWGCVAIANAQIATCSNYHLKPYAVQKSVSMATPLAGSQTSVSTGFRLNVPLKQQDTIKVRLPNQILLNTGGTENGNAAIPTTEGCGTTTFTATVLFSSKANATITFKAAGADLMANTPCTITTAQSTVKAAPTPGTPGEEECPEECTGLSFNLNDVRDIETSFWPSDIGMAIPTAARLLVRTLSIANPFSGQPTTIKVEFKCSLQIDLGKKITVVLPYFALFSGVAANVPGRLPGDIVSNTGALAAPTTPAATVTGCTAAVIASVKVANSQSADATIEFTTAGANNTANTQCAFATANGVAVAPSSTQPANLNTRTIAIESNTAAAPLTSSEAVVDLSLGTTNLTIASPTANTASSMVFGFQPSFPIAAADTVMALLPGFTFTTESPSVTSNCGTVAFTAKTSGSGTSAAAIIFTACGETVSSNTPCILTVASGLHTGGAEAADISTRTLTYQSSVTSPGLTNLPPFSNTVSTSISKSDAVVATPSPSPTPIPTGLPPIAPATAKVKSSVTYGFSASSYIGDTKASHDLGYCIYTAICDSATNLPKSGNSNPVGKVSGRRLVQVDYATQVARGRLSEVISATNSGTASGLQATINNVIATVYPNSTIPAAAVTTFGAATVEVNANNGVLSTSQTGYSSMTQAISFSPSVDYNNATTALAYDKGYGRLLGIYSSAGVYVPGTSVTGYQTSRRSAKSITWISQVKCDGFSVAYNAATASSNSAALQVAIQAVINEEYPVVGNASSPSLLGVTSDQSQCAVHSDGGLSGADIAGIVVGTIAGVLLLVGVIWYVTVSNAAPTCNSQSTADPKVSDKIELSGLSGSGDDVDCNLRACC